MDFNNDEDLRNQGFEGFLTVRELRKDSSKVPSKDKGVYFVINPAYNRPSYIVPGVGGFHQGKDPNVSIDELKINHVRGAQVVYIGRSRRNLHSRIDEFIRFGKSEDIGHYGGRYVWQLENYLDLIICWKKTGKDDPNEVKKDYLRLFKKQYEKRPFANLIG